MIETAICIGIVLSLISIEFIGLAAGGIIVPGYIALQLGSPERLIGLILVVIGTVFLLKCIGKFTFLFGRRQMVVSLLIGTILSIIAHSYLHLGTTDQSDISPIGWVLPGLIAHWSAKQGLIRTLSMLTIMSVIIRFTIILITQGSSIPQINV